MLTKSERGVLRVFREFLMTPGQMLCFYGPRLKAHRTALRQLTEKELVVKEEFQGGYSLTPAGFAAMQEYE